jgi:hypothetical protein
MSKTPEERARFIVKVLDTAQSNVFPSEDVIEVMRPHVDQIRKRYGELRSGSFQEASLASRAEFVAAAIREAENETVRRVMDAISSPYDHVGTIASMRLVEHAPDLVSHKD